MTLTITRKEACELIRSYIGNADNPEKEDFDKIVFAVNNDYQVRDFLLGLPEYYDVKEVVAFLAHMSNEAPYVEDVPFIAVIAAMSYENGQLQDFYTQMGYIATHRPNYSLSKLLMRCAANRFPKEVLTRMRSELASVVMKACYTDTPDQVIVELEDRDSMDNPPTQTNDDHNAS